MTIRSTSVLAKSSKALGVALLGAFVATSLFADDSPKPCTPGTPHVLGSNEQTLNQVSQALQTGKTHSGTTSTAVYDQLYPNYAEMCGASQRAQKIAVSSLGSSVGGPFGHGFFYLKGVCRDLQAPYPQIHVCTDKDAGEHGVGISLDSDFKNTDWVAVQSKDFMLHGLTPPGQPLTMDTYQKTVAEAKALNLLQGVAFSDSFYSNLKPGANRLDAEYESTYGTDYAVENSRDLFCVKVPLQTAELQKMVDFLNQRNAYYQAHNNFVWSSTNNCVTTTDNALAAAGFWKPLPISAPLYALGDVAVPLDSFANWAVRTHDLPIEDPMSIYRDPNARKMLEDSGSLPLRPGVVTEYLGMNSPNAVFSNKVVEQYISAPPLFGVSQSKFQKLLDDPSYLELKPSLLSLQARLLKIKANRIAPAMLTQGLSRQERESGAYADYPAFYASYYDWVDRTLSQVQTQLTRLGP